MEASSRYVALFAAESRDHLQQCNVHLLAWERDPHADEPLQGLFRSVHTLKGMAAALRFSRLANLAHAFEHVLAAVREGSVAPSAELVELSFRVIDRLEQGVAMAVEGRDDAIEDEEVAAELVALARPATGTFPVPALRPEAPAPPPGGVTVRVTLRPGTAMPGARAALVLQRVARLGEISAVTPPPETWGAETFAGEFAFRLAGERREETIRDQVLNVGDVAEVAVTHGPTTEGSRSGAPRQVRVELSRLDRLVQLSGEVSVAGHRLAKRLATLGDRALRDDAEQLDRMLADLQEQVLRSRMAPVGEVFERFPRAVRDLGRQLEKRLRLELEGGEIELDRAILDELPDVLLHLIRNAADHGIERPAARQEAGKPLEGRIRLRARRDRNAVVVSVEDDGRGIDRHAVMARARELGWYQEAASGDLLRILGRPGFSTRTEVSNVSGRGVGIDAVLHRIRGLGGTTDVRTTPGQGTTLSLRLPLTLAVVPALLVRVAQARYAVPLGFVAETARLPARPVGGQVVEYRGRRLPLIALGGGTPARAAGPGVILDVSGRQGALPVDTLLGQEDIVVRPVDAPRGLPRWVNGATILADGLPALILDPTALV